MEDVLSSNSTPRSAVNSPETPPAPADRPVPATGKGLEVSHLRKSYGDLVAVDDLSFHVAPGEILGLIGPNGAGKSTSMNMVAGLLRPDSGTISINGAPYDCNDGRMRALLGIVPQEIAIYPDLTADQNLRFFGALYGIHGATLDERVRNVLGLTGLTHNADNTPSTFSGGMCRRLNFGIALLHRPQFVILDEPTVGIDPQSRSNLLDCVRELSGHGVGVLYASHYMEEVEAVCDRVVIVDHGRILQQGTLDELLDRDQNELRLHVGKLEVAIQEKLKALVDVHPGEDGGSQIFVRGCLSREKTEGQNKLRKVMDVLDEANVPVITIDVHETSLETLFLRLTGRKLRD